jgi:hypothetical protein
VQMQQLTDVDVQAYAEEIRDVVQFVTPADQAMIVLTAAFDMFTEFVREHHGTEDPEQQRKLLLDCWDQYRKTGAH